MRKRKAENLTGEKFGFLTVIEPAPTRTSKNGTRVQYSVCECEKCGRRIEISNNSLKTKTSKKRACASCAAKMRPHNKLKNFNVNGRPKEWHLLAPDGTEYCFTSLTKWLRKNCDLFGFEPDSKKFWSIYSGLSHAKKHTEQNRKICYCNGWAVIPIGIELNSILHCKKETDKEKRVRELYFLGLNQAEIARAMGCSRQNVNSIMKRCGIEYVRPAKNKNNDNF